MRIRLLTLALAAGGLILAGCSDDASAPGGSASLTVLLTDAPGDVDKAWVDLSEIYLQGGGPDGPVTLVDGPTGWIELTGLAGETLALAEGVEVPAGSYGQLRFRVERAALLTVDDRLFATTDAGELPPDVVGRTPDGVLHCPSCGQSGLKANMPGGALQAPGGGSAVVILDLDVAGSYGHEAGGSGRWVMHPLMHVTELALSGRIEGTILVGDGVLPIACGGEERDVTAFVPLATPAAGGDAFSAVVESDGTFAFPYLPPGTYDMGFDEVEYGDPVTGTLVFTASADPAAADVASGLATTVDYEITGVQCDE